MKMELLAPAGSREALISAAANGADAVYFGGSAFNARINAANFSDETAIRSAIDFCHARGIRVYMTLNTLVFDRELHDALKFARFLCASGVDACIVQDVGLVRLIKRYIPELTVHASTQMGISTLGGLEFVESLGITRAVLSRETSLEDIKLMAKKSNVELEAFVHGAMCVSFSGGCLFSSMIGGRSGNRGLCAQPCRKQAACGSKVASDADYALSLGDMCMLRHVKDMYDAGIRCVKIEGRMKKPEYVGAATYAYRRAIDGADKAELDLLEKELYRTFNRGKFTAGYYFGDGCAANRRAGAYAAEDNADIIKPDSDVYRKNPIRMHLVLKVGEKARLNASSRNPLTDTEHQITIEGKTCEAAKSVGGDAFKARLSEQLKKLGGTVFHVEHDSDVQIDGDGVFIAVSEVNELRRRAASELESRFCDEMRPKDVLELPDSVNEDIIHERVSGKRRICAKVVNEEQACAAYDGGADDVVLLAAATGGLLKNVRYLSENYRNDGRRLYLGLPAYIAEKNTGEWESLLKDAADYIDGCEVNNWGQIELAKRFGRVIGGTGLNVLNLSTYTELTERGVDEITLSPELKSAQVRSIIKSVGSFGNPTVGVFGREVLMNLRHCPIRERYGDYACTKRDNNYIADGDERKFPLQAVGVERKCGECVNLLLNCVRLDIRKQVTEDVPDIERVRLNFYDEEPQMVREVIGEMKRGGVVKTMDGTTRGRWNA